MNADRPVPTTDDAGAVAGVISGVVAVASGVFVLTAASAWDRVMHDPITFLGLLGVTLALQLASVGVYGRGRFSFAGAGFLAVGFTFGVAAAMVTCFGAAAINLARGRGKLHRALYTAATWALGAAAGSALYAVAGGRHAPETTQAAAALAAGPVLLLVNVGLLSVAISLAEKTTARTIWREQFRWMTPYYLACGPVALALALAQQKTGLAGMLAFAIPPAFIMISAQQYLRKTRESVEEVRRANDELRRANEQLGARNEDLRDLLDFAAGLAPRVHDRAELVGYAEQWLSGLTKSHARLRIGRGSGGIPLTSGGEQVGTLSLVREHGFDEERWSRLRDAIIPHLATALESTELLEKVRKTYVATIAALTRSMDAKDDSTRGHAERVAAISVALARRLGYSGTKLEAIETGAILHDIGKIGVSEAVLHKAGTLNPAEWEEMRRHPVIADYILSEVDLPPIVREIARSSHERMDGTGYPDGLRGTEIPLPARIVCVADAWDALTSDHVYARARTREAALAEIRAHTGTQFCPTVVAALEELYREEPHLLGAGRLKVA